MNYTHHTATAYHHQHTTGHSPVAVQATDQQHRCPVLPQWRAPRGPPEACSRARARDERVATGDSRIGWGGCGPSGARVLRGRVGHVSHSPTLVPNQLGRVWPSSIRVSQSCRRFTAPDAYASDPLRTVSQTHRRQNTTHKLHVSNNPLHTATTPPRISPTHRTAPTRPAQTPDSSHTTVPP